MTTEEIREMFDGYHVEINLYPSGGMLTIYGCDECGTKEMCVLGDSWNIGRGGSIENAVNNVKEKLNGAETGR